VSRYFGLHAFGEIYGYAFAAFGLGAVIGPLLMGMSFDATGSYRLALWVFVATTLIAAGLMARLGPYRVWEPAAEPVVAAGVSLWWARFRQASEGWHPGISSRSSELTCLDSRFRGNDATTTYLSSSN